MDPPAPSPPLAIRGGLCGIVRFIDRDGRVVPDLSSEGATFPIRTEAGAVVATVTVGADDRFQVSPLTPGRYVVGTLVGFGRYDRDVIEIVDADQATCETPLYLYWAVSDECNWYPSRLRASPAP
jgi:hypothetical protein